MSEAEDLSVSVSETPMSSGSSDDGEWQPPPPWPVEPISVVPAEVLPAVDPGAFCKPRTPDKPRGATKDFGQYEMPPRVNMGAFMNVVTPANVPPEVIRIADQFTPYGPSQRDKPHPIQLAREHKAASEPPPGITGGRVGQMPFYPRVKVGVDPTWQRQWDNEVLRLIASRVEHPTSRAYRREEKKGIMTKQIGEAVQAEFQRLAELRALQDANTERDREVALELQRSEQRLAAALFQRRLFGFAVFVVFMLVLFMLQ